MYKPLCLPPDVFTTNKRGYPVLSKAHQELLATAFRFGVQVILTGELNPNTGFIGCRSTTGPRFLEPRRHNTTHALQFSRRHDRIAAAICGRTQTLEPGCCLYCPHLNLNCRAHHCFGDLSYRRAPAQSGSYSYSSWTSHTSSRSITSSSSSSRERRQPAAIPTSNSGSSSSSWSRRRCCVAVCSG